MFGSAPIGAVSQHTNSLATLGIPKLLYCIVLFLRHVQRLYHFSNIQLSTADLIRT